MIADMDGQVKLSALVLTTLTVFILLPLSGEAHSRPARSPDKVDHLLPLLCTQPSLTPSPPSSVHTLRPSDVAVVSAIGLPTSHRNEVLLVLKRLSELFSLFNPSVTSLIAEDTEKPSSLKRTLSDQSVQLALSLHSHQVFEHDWKLVLLYASVDEVCTCPEQARAAVVAAVQEFDQALQTLRSQLHHTLVSAIVWPGGAGTTTQDDSTCSCTITQRVADLRLRRAAFAQALQESLQRHLETRAWYGDRDDFAIQLQETPMDVRWVDSSVGKVPPAGNSVLDTDRLAIQLWSNLLQPMAEKHDRDILRASCPKEYQPYLRTWKNSPPELQPQVRSRDEDNAAIPPLEPVMGSEFPCVDRNPSPTPPRSVHALRPADVKVVAAVGDSLTAANGAGGSPNNVLDIVVEYRGISWSIGGDGNLTSVTTLPNIFRQFNPSLTGYSVGTGKEDSPSAYLNQAVAGANSDDMPQQVRVLVDKMKNDPRIDFHNDWKVITMFIGGNDLCDHCTDSVYYSAENLVSHIRQALDILHQEVPRALVNLVEMMDIVPLRRLHQDDSLKCPTWLINIICRCVVKSAEDSAELQKMKDLNQAYQRGMWKLVESGRYDTHPNFTVVLQPFFREVVLPLLEDGRPDRSYFAADCFHLSQKSHSLMARALWNNMLEPLGNKTFTQDFTSDISLKCPSEGSPYLRTYQNSNYTYEELDPPPPAITNWGSNFLCNIQGPSDPVPTSAHRLQPADIKVVASLGDSITTGFGAKSESFMQLKEYRGVSWSIGGDQTLDTVTTLPNILRKFNPLLVGVSRDLDKKEKGFNMAVSGARAFEIPAQVQSLIQALKNSKDVDFENDWKLVTLFIGGNDLCQYCVDRAFFSPRNYSRHLQESLDILYREVPRTMVIVLEILQIDSLRKITRNTLGCSLLQKNLCPCVLTPSENSLELSELKRFNREYQVETEQLVFGGRYDGREDFALVLQPYFQNTIVPLAQDGRPDFSFFSVDCFHFTERGHAEMAAALWNNMLEPVGKKQAFNNFTYDRNKLRCPTEDQPFIFTTANSIPSMPTVSTTTSTSASASSTSLCSGSVPAWVVALVAVVCLLFASGFTGLLFSYQKQRGRKKTSNLNVEMKGTGL